MLSKERVRQWQERLLTTLEQLLELPITDVNSLLDQMADLIVEVLSADKSYIFLYDAATDTLVPHGISDIPIERQRRALDMDQLLIKNGGSLADVFLTGIPYLTRHAGQTSGDWAEMQVKMGVKSEIATIFKVKMQHQGVIVASSNMPDFFSEQDMHFLQGIACQVGIIIQHAEFVERMRLEAVEQDKLLMAEELLTIMAHDLHNYLTPLKGCLQLIERRARREGREQDIHVATVASNTLASFTRIISAQLDVTRLKQGIFTIRPQILNVTDLIQEMVLTFSQSEAPIHVHTPHEVLLSADPDRLRQALLNLLANAVKYAPKHTPITVQVDKEERTDGPWMLLMVSNGGRSISPEQRMQFFRPFVTSETSMSLGLGLYLANRIAVAHSGTLTVDSPQGQGVLVTLALPMYVNGAMAETTSISST